MALLPRSREEFREKDYWDDFFKKRRKAFEWYGDYTDLCGILAKYVKPKDQILVAGCGNSKLSLDLYDVGYRKITNVDISDIVINQMQKQNRNSRPDMQWLCMDLKQMGFEDDSYSVVLDKGTTDALLTDESNNVIGDVQQMFQEISRVLRVGGRFVMVSLLQPHVAREALTWFYKSGWMLRVCRCIEAEESERRANSITFPVFIVVATKLKLIPGVKPVVELNLCDDAIQRLDELESVFTEVASLQKFAILQHRLASVVMGNDENNAVVELVSPTTQNPRYSIHVVDQRKTERTMAVFIVPQGRELEWLFSSSEGRQQLAETANFGRLLVVHLHRDQDYKDLKTVQEELSAKVLELAPAGMPRNFQVPFLSVGNSIGHCKVVKKGESSCSGLYRIEEVEGESGLVRRLVFLSNTNAIQSEVKLIKGKCRVGKRKRIAVVDEIDTNSLCCEHHQCMAAGLGLLPASRTSRILLIGLGGGTLASFMLSHFQKVLLDCIELDGEIVHIAHEWFGLPKSDRLKVHVMDGLEFVAKEAEKGAKYDSVIVDVDNKDMQQGLSAPPISFLENQFLTNTSNLLSASGFLMLNLACRNTKLRQESIHGVLKEFPNVFSHKIPENINQLLYCYKATCPSEEDVKKRLSTEMSRVCSTQQHLSVEKLCT